jgi:hypothetical protein
VQTETVFLRLLARDLIRYDNVFVKSWYINTFTAIDAFRSQMTLIFDRGVEDTEII